MNNHENFTDNDAILNAINQAEEIHHPLESPADMSPETQANLNAGENRNPHSGRTPQVDILMSIAQEATLFHTPDGIGYGDITINGHRETWSIRSNGFSNWLNQRFFKTTGTAPGSDNMEKARATLEAKALYEGCVREVHVRVGSHQGAIYIDLCNPEWEAVEIRSDGWSVIADPPVRFRRIKGMLALPEPVKGGSIEALRHFINLSERHHFVLAVHWLLDTLRCSGPHPLIIISGEQGSAKSTLCETLRSLVDPHVLKLRSLPTKDQELFIAANNSYVLAFDNVSSIPNQTSDTLCRISTGGGFATRQLYSDNEEVLFNVCRPLMLNSIEDVVTRPDLADRAIFLNLRPIPEKDRRPSKEVMTAFEAERPRLLGAILDGAVQGLKQVKSVRLSETPRMADFAVWATACETAFWPPGTFELAYKANLAASNCDVIDSNPTALGIRMLMSSKDVWRGTATELRNALRGLVSHDDAGSRAVPTHPATLCGQLRRSMTSLRTIGIDISFNREGNQRTRIITIVNRLVSEKLAETSSAASAASALPKNTEEPAEIERLEPGDMHTDGWEADDTEQ